MALKAMQGVSQGVAAGAAVYNAGKVGATMWNEGRIDGHALWGSVKYVCLCVLLVCLLL